MIPLRKEHAGSCSFGYTWPQDGSVVEVTPEHAVALLAIPDGDYTAVEAEPDPTPDAATPKEPTPKPTEVAIEEPAPAAELSEAPAPRKAAAKKTAAKKETAPAPAAPTAVEE